MDKRDEYWKFADVEDRFNSIQAGIRKRASTWLLAGIMYLISGKHRYPTIEKGK